MCKTQVSVSFARGVRSAPRLLSSEGVNECAVGQDLRWPDEGLLLRGQKVSLSVAQRWRRPIKGRSGRKFRSGEERQLRTGEINSEAWERDR